MRSPSRCQTESVVILQVGYQNHCAGAAPNEPNRNNHVIELGNLKNASAECKATARRYRPLHLQTSRH